MGVSLLFSAQVDNKDWVEERLIHHYRDKRHSERSREWLLLTDEDVQRFPEIVGRLSAKCKRAKREVQ